MLKGGPQTNYLPWRDKVDTGASDKMFMQANGGAFRSKQSLSMFVSDLVKPQFLWYHGCMGRHWGINARLIDWALTTLARPSGRGTSLWT